MPLTTGRSGAPRRSRRRRVGDVNTIPRSTSNGVRGGITQYAATGWTKPTTPTGPSVGTEIAFDLGSSTQDSIATDQTLDAFTCDVATISGTTSPAAFSQAGKPEDVQTLFPPAAAAVGGGQLPPPTYAIPHGVDDALQPSGTISTSPPQGLYQPISPLIIDPDFPWSTSIPQLDPWSSLPLDHSPTHATTVAPPPSPLDHYIQVDSSALDTALLFSQSSFPNHIDQQNSPLMDEFLGLSLLDITPSSPLGHSPTPSISISLEPPDIDVPSIMLPSPQWSAGGLMPIPDSSYSPASSPGSTYSSAHTPSDSSGPDSPTVHRSGSSTSSLAGAITGRSPREHYSKNFRHSPY